MARKTVPLSDAQIRAAKARDKEYKLVDGEGLYLLVTPAGGKHWKLKYRFDGRERKLSLGAYPDVSLQAARAKRAQHREEISAGLDPAAAKREREDARREEAMRGERTFELVARKRLEAVRGDISEEHYRRQIDALENDVFPFIGQKFVDDVGAPDIIAVIRRMMERDVKDSARKVFYAINRTYKWAVSNLLAQRNPAADIDLKELIGERNENHYPTITDDDGVMLLLQAIEDDTGAFTTKQALRFMPYVFVRPTNIRHAEWGEFNFKTKQWVIPGHKMKTKQELIVPLTDSAIAILEETREMTAGSRYVFPSLRTRTEPMSDAALLNAVRRMGYSKEQFVPHGFRAMFSTIAHERSPFSHEAIETQLAHSVGSSVSKAYNRAKYLKERVQLMQWWSDHLDALKARR